MRSLAIGAAGCAAAWSLPALAPVVPAVSRVIGVSGRIDAGNAGVAITFDDGPHPQGTPAILAALERGGARATFFLVGEQVERRPALAREIAAAGHGVALHGHRHRNLLRMSPRALARDLEQGAHAIAEATGREPVLYRPPYGVFSPAGLILARRLRLTPLLWSRWGHDWSARATAESIASELTEAIAPGDVLLLHDADFYNAAGSWIRTAAALPLVLEEVVRRGLRCVLA